MSDLRQKIAKSLINVPGGLTASEIANEFNIKPTSVSGMCQQMLLDETVEIGENIESTARLWKITLKGIKMYGNKSDQIIESEKKKRGRPRKVPLQNNAL